MVNPLRLADDRLQGLRELAAQVVEIEGRRRLLDEQLVGDVDLLDQILGLAGDDGERVVDFVPGPRGELGQGAQLLLLEPGLLLALLGVERGVEPIEIAVQAVDPVAIRAGPGLNGQTPEIGAERLLLRRFRVGRDDAFDGASATR